MRDPEVVRRKQEVRERIWRLMEERRAAAFPLPPRGRIPNFVGAEGACRALLATPEWRRARVVKVNPDAPQRPCREAALAEGKALVMPTPRLREGFLLLDGLARAARQASTIRGAFAYGRPVDPRALPQVDLVVIGSVAVNPRTGARLGKSHGYAELEWGILTQLGKASPDTPVATTVHDLQLVEEDLPQEPFDLPVDLVATPSALHRTRPGKKPSGILWRYVTEDLLREIPLLAQLKA